MCILALNNRTHSATGLSPFFITHSYYINVIQTHDIEEPVNIRADQGQQIVLKIKEATEWVQVAIAIIQQRQEEITNGRRDSTERFKEGDKVWLNLINVYTERPSKKFNWLHSKYTITKVVSSHFYRLDIPLGIHPVFHVDLLKKAVTDPFPLQV